MILISGLLCYKSCWLISMATRSLTSDTDNVIHHMYKVCVYKIMRLCEREKHEGRRGQRPSLHNTLCVYALSSSDFYTWVCVWACVCVCVRVFPSSREANQRLTSSSWPWVCMCIPLCEISPLANVYASHESGKPCCMCVRPRDMPGE